MKYLSKRHYAPLFIAGSAIFVLASAWRFVFKADQADAPAPDAAVQTSPSSQPSTAQGTQQTPQYE